MRILGLSSANISWDEMLGKYSSSVRGMGTFRAASFMCIWRGIEASFLSRVKLAPPHLDCGCGDGTFSLVTFGPQIGIGVDIDLPSLEKAQAHRSCEDLLRADLTALPLRNSAFGSVVSNSVIEHVADDSAVLQEIRRVSARGSHLYLTSISGNIERYTLLEQALSRFHFSPFNEIRTWYAAWMRQIFVHRRFYTLSSLAEIVDNSGYRTIISTSFGGPLFTAIWSLLTHIVTPLPWPLLNLLQLLIRSQIISSKGAILVLL